ncbi:hypothetical protein GGS20DRAFT_183240 [Poronia punctata]|nr:hypothetical protein GGS20DRAFT_183240 [Poronia punctata]
MTSLQSPVSPSPLSTSTPTSTTPAPFRKLRDSCHNCALSKLRCSKEKPTCARCMRQGKTCGYVPSKRAGRTQTMRSDGKGSRSKKSPTPTPMPRESSSSETSAETAPATMSPESIHLSLAQPSACFQDMLPGLFSNPEESSLPSPSTYTPQFFDMSGISMPWSLFEPMGSTGSSQSDALLAHTFSDPDLHQSIFPTPESNVSLSDISIIPDTSIPSQSHGEDNRPHSLPTPTDIASDSYCDCMGRALELFRKLSLEHPGNAKCPSRKQEAGVNKKHVQTILNMLECSCSEDSYLVHLMCLLVFKIMSLYNHAIRRGEQADTEEEQGSDHKMADSPTAKEDHRIQEEDRIRITAQSFFGELHLVQRLIGLLSGRLKGFGTGNMPKANIPETAGVKNENGGSSIPVTLLHQLEVDLRRRLRALSGEIVDIIRDG